VRASAKPLVTAPLIVVKESMVSGMMNNLIAQGGIPSLRARDGAPIGFSKANQTEEQGFIPPGLRTRCTEKPRPTAV
jgi:hypothetical protein